MPHARHSGRRGPATDGTPRGAIPLRVVLLDAAGSHGVLPDLPRHPDRPDAAAVGIQLGPDLARQAVRRPGEFSHAAGRCQLPAGAVHTTAFAAMTVAASVVLALLVALPLARRLRFEGAYQLIYFLPFITPTVPEAVVWKWIYDARYGVLNYLLSLLGIPPVGWLLEPRTTLWAVIIMSVWKTLGYNMVLFIIGLRAIPAEYTEAGLIDGATGWRFFRSLTLPLLMPTVLLVTVISTIGAYNVFTQVYIMAADIQGSPGSVVRVLIYDIFENAFRYYRMGYASAEATVFFAIVLALTLVQFRVLRSWT